MSDSKLITALGLTLGMALVASSFAQVSRACGPSSDTVSVSKQTPKEIKEPATPSIVEETPLCGPSAPSSPAKNPRPDPPARHKVTLSWNPSVPATNSPRDAIVGYYVYRKTTDGSSYDDKNKLNATPLPGTKCVDILVEPGRTYFYVTRAISAGGAVSKNSNEAKAVIPNP